MSESQLHVIFDSLYEAVHSLIRGGGETVGRALVLFAAEVGRDFTPEFGLPF